MSIIHSTSTLLRYLFSTRRGPYGSNVIEVPATQAHRYKYVVRFERLGKGDNWTVVIWNKIAPDGTIGGWYGKACKKFALAAGQIRYIAFNGDSQGGWAAAPGSLVPVDGNGGYASTWGEFDFGSTVNLGWSGFDVSAIAAQNAGLEVQGMKICEVLTRICSYIGPAAAFVHNAYTSAVANIGGIGGSSKGLMSHLAIKASHKSIQGHRGLM